MIGKPHSASQTDIMSLSVCQWVWKIAVQFSNKLWIWFYKKSLANSVLRSISNSVLLWTGGIWQDRLSFSLVVRCHTNPSSFDVAFESLTILTRFDILALIIGHSVCSGQLFCRHETNSILWHCCPLGLLWNCSAVWADRQANLGCSTVSVCYVLFLPFVSFLSFLVLFLFLVACYV